MMDSYKIEWKHSAKKELKRMPKATISKILTAVESLSENPFPRGIRKIIGTENIFRMRIGDYRIVYFVESNKLIIQIIKVGHRRDIYKKLA